MVYTNKQIRDILEVRHKIWQKPKQL